MTVLILMLMAKSPTWVSEVSEGVNPNSTVPFVHMVLFLSVFLAGQPKAHPRSQEVREGVSPNSTISREPETGHWKKCKKVLKILKWFFGLSMYTNQVPQLTWSSNCKYTISLDQWPAKLKNSFDYSYPLVISKYAERERDRELVVDVS